MPSITDPQSDLPSEELVAYLDGELSPEDSRRVEERLAQDADYRQ
jgi:anti-sigma factor RsiW